MTAHFSIEYKDLGGGSDLSYGVAFYMAIIAILLVVAASVVSFLNLRQVFGKAE